MNIYCLKSGINQSDEERNANLEMLRKLITPESGIDGGAAAEETAEQRPQLQSAIDLLASGKVESICFTTPDVLARSEDDIANLKSFLSENNVGLTVDAARIGPNVDDRGHKTGGTDTGDVAEADAS